MITFEPLREYMQKHGKSIYCLSKDKVIGGATLDKIRADEQRVSLYTVDRICEYLKCKPKDVFAYIPGDKQDKEEAQL